MPDESDIGVLQIAHRDTDSRDRPPTQESRSLVLQLVAPNTDTVLRVSSSGIDTKEKTSGKIRVKFVRKTGSRINWASGGQVSSVYHWGVSHRIVCSSVPFLVEVSSPARSNLTQTSIRNTFVFNTVILQRGLAYKCHALTVITEILFKSRT